MQLGRPVATGVVEEAREEKAAERVEVAPRPKEVPAPVVEVPSGVAGR
ncbi:glycine cleavage system aminomethyltransferase T [Embleya sp. AB8]